MQYLVTIIAPDDSEHEFVLPQDKPLRELMYSILIHLRLPLTRYELIDAATGEYLALDSTLDELFPGKAIKLRLENWQERIKRSIEVSKDYYQRHQEDVRAKTEPASYIYTLIMISLFAVFGFIALIFNVEKATNPMRRSFERFQAQVADGNQEAAELICFKYRDMARLDLLRPEINEYRVIDHSSYRTTAWLTLERNDDSEPQEIRIINTRTVRMELESGQWVICDAAFLGITISE